MKATIPTYQEWLAEHCQNSCLGCAWNIPHKAHCTYPGPHCVEYDRELTRLRERAREKEPELWEKDESLCLKKC